MDFIIGYMGEIAGVISFAAYLLYIISIFRGKTKPSRSTWWILTLVGILIFATSYSLEATESMWIQLSYIVGPLIIAILSLFSQYGYKEGLLKIDKICLAGAVICAFIWFVFNSPFIALLGSIVVDFIGLIPTMKKAYIDPEHEDPSAWALEFLASAMNVFAISAWFSLEEKDWIYALYLFLVNGIVAALLWRRRLLGKFRSV